MCICIIIPGNSTWRKQFLSPLSPSQGPVVEVIFLTIVTYIIIILIMNNLTYKYLLERHSMKISPAIISTFIGISSLLLLYWLCEYTWTWHNKRVSFDLWSAECRGLLPKQHRAENGQMTLKHRNTQAYERKISRHSRESYPESFDQEATVSYRWAKRPDSCKDWLKYEKLEQMYKKRMWAESLKSRRIDGTSRLLTMWMPTQVKERTNLLYIAHSTETSGLQKKILTN